MRKEFYSLFITHYIKRTIEYNYTNRKLTITCILTATQKKFDLLRLQFDIISTDEYVCGIFFQYITIYYQSEQITELKSAMLHIFNKFISSIKT